MSEVREFNLTVSGGATNPPEQWYWQVHQKPTQYHDDLIAVDKDDHDRVVAEMQKRIDEETSERISLGNHLAVISEIADQQRERIAKLEAALKRISIGSEILPNGSSLKFGPFQMRGIADAALLEGDKA